jgi:glutathione S-transferase
MSRDLVFYTHPMSRGRIIRWMMEEVGQPYDTVVLDFGTTMKGPEYLAVNPMGKVPAVRHGDVVITEAGAICAYLADAFPQAGLAPAPGDPLRAPYYRWMFFAAGPLEQVVTNRAMAFEPPPERRALVGYGTYEDTMNAIEYAVTGRDYLLGDRFSAADVYFGAHIGWGMSFGGIEKRPAFERYVERVSARPAAVRAREIDDGLIAAAQQQPVPA